MLTVGRKLYYSSNSSTALAPKTLYKYLIRQCNRLPDVEVQKYYKHHIRQSFIQHADETETERIQQITKQAVKDFDWILKKYKVIKDDQPK